ncbi:MAG: GFA family protein [Lentisphaeraceae bacterium]|nr:GFA family protein [Lentisphaeraceae bacterium]
MTTVIKASGKCLCGAVEIQTAAMSTNVGACHCNMCRKWAGGPFMAVDCKDDVTISGQEYVSIYNSSEWAERAFCSKCGTHLFYRLKQNNQHIMAAGFFDNESRLDFDHQIFIDEKPEYYSFQNETHNMTGEEVFAMFNGETQEQ